METQITTKKKTRTDIGDSNKGKGKAVPYCRLDWRITPKRVSGKEESANSDC